MRVINWLALQPLLADVDILNTRLQESMPVHKVCRHLVEITLQGYPWAGRSDLIACYHPSRTYIQGQWIAVPVTDPQNLHPTAWQVAHVKSAETTGNSIQGRFQALILDVGGREVHRTSGIAGASYPEPELTNHSAEQFDWLVEWVAETYAGSLRATIKKLIQKGKIFGQLAGETFLPEQLFALSIDRLHPFFERLSPLQRWLSLEEILLGLPDLAALKHETALALIRSTLKVSPYRSLGADHWTTSGFFDCLDRKVPYGLPAAHPRSNASHWTDQDKKDLGGYKKKSIPAEAAWALEELGIQETCSKPDQSTWQPPNGLIRLPALSYLHITQAYFPVGGILHAFAPDVCMVFVQFFKGDFQPYLLDREYGLLKAVNPERLRDQLLAASLPAGTHLWLEYLGNERYRIAPQPLSSKRWVPCKRVSLEGGQLRIEQSQIQMEYESDPSVFKAVMSFEDMEVLFAEAKNCHLSVREALISAIQEICAADLGKRAHLPEIFNLVFLKRICSPHSIAVLLYTQPCFVQLDGNYFRYRLVADTPVINIWKNTNRVSQLWEDLVSNCVTPDPVTKHKSFPEIYELVPAERLLPSLEPAEITTDISVRATVTITREAGEPRENTLIGKVGLQSINLFKHVLEHITVLPTEAPAAYPDREGNLDMVPGSQDGLEKPELPTFTVADPVIPPVFVKVSREPDLQPASAIDTRRIVYGLKIPARPLHKRPYYQRLFFSLRSWIYKISGKNHDRMPH